MSDKKSIRKSIQMGDNKSININYYNGAVWVHLHIFGKRLSIKSSDFYTIMKKYDEIHKAIKYIKKVSQDCDEIERKSKRKHSFSSSESDDNKHYSSSSKKKNLSLKKRKPKKDLDMELPLSDSSSSED